MRWLDSVSVCSGAMPLALQGHGTLVAVFTKLRYYRWPWSLARSGATRLAILLTFCIIVGPLRAAGPANYDDAPLYAVRFVDREEGWAAGDEGVIWHTIDGGTNWER